MKQQESLAVVLAFLALLAAVAQADFNSEEPSVMEVKGLPCETLAVMSGVRAPWGAGGQGEDMLDVTLLPVYAELACMRPVHIWTDWPSQWPRWLAIPRADPSTPLFYGLRTSGGLEGS